MITHGDCLEEMAKMEANSISAIVTDPPYGLGFMGKKWDAGLPHEHIWKEALRVIKPGGHLLAFGGTRMFHRLTCAIEDAGWEIRDCLMWLYGSGFPKSHNHFGLEGYGTALKPAWEPIIMAMKPCEGTFKENAEKWGQAGINVDGCRIESSDNLGRPRGEQLNIYGKFKFIISESHPKGRWPANVLLDEEAAAMLDEQSGQLKSGELKPYKSTCDLKALGWGFSAERDYVSPANAGGASRFFYCAKASPSERGEGNKHPTVKPIKLMEYLIKLVMPPKEGVLLDPFAGSGTTILAAKRLGYDAIGIEKEEEYCTIARERIA